MIKIEGLKKKFGEFTAVDGLSFDISGNEIFVLLGPNGDETIRWTLNYLYHETLFCCPDPDS